MSTTVAASSTFPHPQRHPVPDLLIREQVSKRLVLYLIEIELKGPHSIKKAITLVLVSHCYSTRSEKEKGKETLFERIYNNNELNRQMYGTVMKLY